MGSVRQAPANAKIGGRQDKRYENMNEKAEVETFIANEGMGRGWGRGRKW